MSDGGNSLGGLAISSSLDAGVAEIALRGELDLASAPALEQELSNVERRDPQRVVIDLTGLGFIDSTGLRLLLQAQARASEHSRELLLRPGGDAVQRVFAVTGALEVLRFEQPAEGSSET
ncbi:MAG TPA: STAS domain-containing protein [Solirubrobacteraceae bacterium]|jgi:anti-sigma B factor antagonist